MNLGQVIIEANNIADEQESPDILVGFVNDAIAKINIECNANFPFMSISQQGIEFVFPEKWVRALVLPFVVGRIKQRDSSQFEYTDAYNEFMNNLEEFKTKYAIPDEYKDEEAQDGFYESDVYEKPPFPWWGRW